jgi:hypothetical protein
VLLIQPACCLRATASTPTDTRRRTLPPKPRCKPQEVQVVVCLVYRADNGMACIRSLADSWASPSVVAKCRQVSPSRPIAPAHARFRKFGQTVLFGLPPSTEMRPNNCKLISQSPGHPTRNQEPGLRQPVRG